MALNFHTFLLIYIFFYLSNINHLNGQRLSGSDTEEDLTKGLTNEELEQALGTLSLNDLNSLKRFMDSSYIVNEDNYDMENSEDDGSQRHMQNYQFDNSDSDSEFNDNAYKLDENVIKYKRAVLAAHLSWDNKRRVRDTNSQLKSDTKLKPMQTAAVANAAASEKNKEGSDVVKTNQPEEEHLAVQQQEKNEPTRSVKAEVLRTKRENSPGQIINEEYLRQLENSFPRDQGQNADDAVAESKEHVRVKRQ